MALICPPALAEDGATAEVDLRATVVKPFCVVTLAACDVGPTEAILWGAVVAWPPPSHVDVSFGWDTTSHKDDPGGYPNWVPGDTLLLGLVFHTRVSGLTPGKTYYFRARAQADGYTGYGCELSFTTLSEFSVITLPAKEIESKKATLYGKTIGRSRSPKATVSFGWDTQPRADKKYKNWTSAQNVYVGDTFSARLTNLKPNTTYYFRARAVRGGVTYYGEELSFATPPQKSLWDWICGN